MLDQKNINYLRLDNLKKYTITFTRAIEFQIKYFIRLHAYILRLLSVL